MSTPLVAPLAPSVAALINRLPLRAGGFIVTLYGDAVGPRGGEVWAGSVIEVCALVGISETLVRTALSRLVAAGTVESRRAGRRSYYRLTPAAEREFQAASLRIYGPLPEPRWRLVVLPDDGAVPGLERQGFVRLRPRMMLGAGDGPLPDGAMAFDLGDPQGAALLPALAADLWDLDHWAGRYRAFVQDFAPLITEAGGLDDPSALALRLALVDAWRHLRLRDPGLPPQALPPDWPGLRAQAVYATLYAALAPVAERALAERLIGPGPALAPDHAEIARRADLLAALGAQGNPLNVSHKS